MDGYSSINGGAGYGPEPRTEGLRARSLLPESPSLVRGEPVSAKDVLQKVAEHSRTIPPPDDLLQVTAAAARYALTNLDSAKQIAREVREAQERMDAEQARSLTVLTDRNEAAEALGV